ncbi:MAG: hypothetical protein ACR2PH_10135, partial [Desulfobulbia bacterium]
HIIANRAMKRDPIIPRSTPMVPAPIQTQHKGTLNNYLFIQTLRCAKKFYPWNINYMPVVKFSHAP